MNTSPTTSTHRLNVLFIAAEADPLIKKGGLGDVAGSLPLALKIARPDLDIRLAIPHYDGLNPNYPVEFLLSYTIPSADGPVKVEVSRTVVNGLTVYLIGGDPIHADKAVYVNDPAILGERFVFFSIACLYLPAQLDWPIDILHAHDWHTGIALHQLASLSKTEKSLKSVRSIMTIHNLPFMGAGSEQALQKFLIQPAINPRMPVWSRTLPLPMGLNAADSIVAVSSGYAREILTPGFGCDLQDFLSSKKSRISGILNGIDYSMWNPVEDKEIIERFTMDSISKRAVNKTSLQKELKLPQNAATPLLAVIGRLDRQKGIDIVIESMTRLAALDWQLVVLAYGDDKGLESDLLKLVKAYPKKVSFKEELNLPLSRRIYASADMLLMPSRYEPCGLAQMIAMHYGCVPIASATGGLKDTIRDAPENSESANGFLSAPSDAAAFTATIQKALSSFQDDSTWRRMQQNGMKTDFSWQKPANEYLALYNRLTK